MNDLLRKKATLIIEDEDGFAEVTIRVNATIRWTGVRWALADPDVGRRYADNVHAGLLTMLGTKLGTEP